MHSLKQIFKLLLGLGRAHQSRCADDLSIKVCFAGPFSEELLMLACAPIEREAGTPLTRATTISGGRSGALLVGGVVFVLLALFLIWTATLGKEWNSTHNRIGRRTPRVSERQIKFNTAAGIGFGAFLLAAGIALIAVTA